jgi:hypothetical protein
VEGDWKKKRLVAKMTMAQHWRMGSDIVSELELRNVGATMCILWNEAKSSWECPGNRLHGILRNRGISNMRSVGNPQRMKVTLTWTPVK